MIRKSLYLTLLSGLFVLMSGCAPKPQPPIHRYTIVPETPGITKSASAPLLHHLSVEVENDTPMTASTAIYYRKQNFQQQPYAYSRWYAPPATMLRNKIVLALQKSALATTVTDKSLEADATLHLLIIDFVQEFSPVPPSKVHLTLLATFKTKNFQRSKLLRLAIPTPSDDAQGGVTAFNQGCDRLVPQIVEWIERMLISE